MRYFLKAWVAIMIALITALSLGLNAFNVLSHVHWSLIAFITFIIFAVIVIWRDIKKEQFIDKLLADRPHIISEPFGFNLRVRNSGASAKFIVEITINDKSEETWRFPLSGYWQKTKSNESEIIKGGYDYVLIGKVNKKSLKIFYYDADTKSINEKRLPVSECTLDIKVISNPSMLNTKIETYQLNSKGLSYLESVTLD